MTPFSKLVTGKEGQTLSDANELIWERKLNCLPIINDHFRKGSRRRVKSSPCL